MSEAGEQQSAGGASGRGAASSCGASAIAHVIDTPELPSCPACGAVARRPSARFCATCGASLLEREYHPADALRASYRWQKAARPAARFASWPSCAAWRHRNGPTVRAYVFLAYGLLPFVGVVFCACAVACGAAGLREARPGGREGEAVEARRAVVFAVLLAGAHALLWLFVVTIPVWL